MVDSESRKSDDGCQSEMGKSLTELSFVQKRKPVGRALPDLDSIEVAQKKA
jgi:hypothetical protein